MKQIFKVIRLLITPMLVNNSFRSEMILLTVRFCFVAILGLFIADCFNQAKPLGSSLSFSICIAQNYKPKLQWCL
jgi:hypothetical protein